MHNNKFFGPEFKVFIRFNDTCSNIINRAAFQPHKDMATDKYVFKDLSCDMPSIKKSTTPPLIIYQSNVIKQKEKVLFICYTPNGTMK